VALMELQILCDMKLFHLVSSSKLTGQRALSESQLPYRD
jgi:hypothetical protein